MWESTNGTSERSYGSPAGSHGITCGSDVACNIIHKCWLAYLIRRRTGAEKCKQRNGQYRLRSFELSCALPRERAISCGSKYMSVFTNQE